MTDLFVEASRKAFRYTSIRGELTTEQLWDLPLTSRSGFDLDSVAKAVNADLKAETEESFVSTIANPRKGDLETKLEVVKFIIADKIAEAERAAQRIDKMRQRAEILDAIAAKDKQSLSDASKDELLKKLAELDA